MINKLPDKKDWILLVSYNFNIFSVFDWIK